MQHGQKIHDGPQELLTQAGFEIREPAASHLCCGSAGAYNILQPHFAGRLGDDKAASLNALDADVATTGNIGCMMQLSSRCKSPVIHTVELMDWATGGERPQFIDHIK